jgi:hypothetical protein
MDACLPFPRLVGVLVIIFWFLARSFFACLSQLKDGRVLPPLNFIFLADKDQSDYYWDDDDHQTGEQTVKKVS